MLELNLALLILGGLVILLGLFSSLIKGRLFISDPIVALFVGIIISPGNNGLNWVGRVYS
jgi:NhaP-type Na+/H+ or K+/H+ antiporter